MTTCKVVRTTSSVAEEYKAKPVPEALKRYFLGCYPDRRRAPVAKCKISGQRPSAAGNVRQIADTTANSQLEATLRSSSSAAGRVANFAGDFNNSRNRSAAR